MTIEVLSFRITVSVKDKESKQIKKLTKQVNLKIDWRGKRGFLNPEWKKYIRVDGRHDPKMDSWESRGEVIRFEKDGKKYDILVKFDIKRGWFSDKVEVKGFKAYPPSAPFVTSNISDDRERKQMEYAIIPTYQRKEGPTLVKLVVVVIIVAVILFAWWRYKKDKQKV